MQKDMISGDMRFIGTKKETLYQMSKKSKQLFNAYKFYQTAFWIKETKIDKQGYSITFEIEIGADATDSDKKYVNAMVSIPLEKVIGKTVTLQYDDCKRNVPGENAVIGILYERNGKKRYEMLYSTNKRKAITFFIPEDAMNVRVRLLVIENKAGSVLAGKYEVTFEGIMLSVGKTRRKWEPYKE